MPRQATLSALGREALLPRPKLRAALPEERPKCSHGSRRAPELGALALGFDAASPAAVFRPVRRISEFHI